MNDREREGSSMELDGFVLVAVSGSCVLIVLSAGRFEASRITEVGLVKASI